MQKKYIIGAIVAILVLVGNQFFIQYWLSNTAYDANTINIAGRQRMLSQQISLLYHQLVTTPSVNSELAKKIEEWNDGHSALLTGNKSSDIRPVDNKEALILLNKLTPKIEFINDLYYKSSAKLNETRLKEIDQNQKSFLADMEKVVKLLEQEAVAKIYFIRIMEVVLTLASVTIILLEIIFIFSPMTMKLRSSLSKVSEIEQRVKAIYNSNQDAVSFLDKQYKILFNNLAAKRITKAVFGKEAQPGENFLDYILPDNQEETRQLYNRVIAGETVEYKRTDGENWWQFTLFPVYDNDNNIFGLSHNCKNITKRVELQQENEYLSQKLSLIAENFPNGSVTLLTPELTILYSNGDGYNKHGIDPTKYIGLALGELLSKKSYEAISRYLPRVLEGETVEYQIEFQGLTYLNTVKPVLNASGEVEKIIFISIDISPLIEYQNKVIAQSKRLEKIAWTQAHDVRGPLASIMGLIDLLVLEKGKEMNWEYIDLLQKASSDLDAVIYKIILQASSIGDESV